MSLGKKLSLSKKSVQKKKNDHKSKETISIICKRKINKIYFILLKRLCL